VRWIGKSTTAGGAFPVRFAVVCLALFVSVTAVAAQELTPRTYWPTPKDTKVGVLGYGYAEGDVLFDPSIPLYGVDSQANVMVAAYLQTIGLWGRTATVLLEAPYQWGSSQGLIGETPASGTISGFGDPGVTLTVNLLGAPTMTPQDFQALREKPHPILGASLKVVIPVGQYDPNRLLNAGGNRWAVKAEFGSAIPLRPKLLLEIEGGVWFFGDNDDFIAGPREQDPIVGFEMHLVRRFRPGFWISLDGTMYFGGRQAIDGRELIDFQTNSRIGGTLVVPFKGRHAVKLGIAKGVYTKYGEDFDQYLVSYQVLFN
jgi:hypothetical protein